MNFKIEIIKNKYCIYQCSISLDNKPYNIIKSKKKRLKLYGILNLKIYSFLSDPTSIPLVSICSSSKSNDIFSLNRSLLPPKNCS